MLILLDLNLNRNDVICYIMFVSKALGKSREKYSATKRELLGIIFALKSFREYIFGRHFTLYTDHSALTYILTQEKTNHMIDAWYLV